MTSKTFSIITVTLNNLDGLKRTHNSILLQETDDYEWIVMDGGSDDASIAYLESCRADWVSQKDKGIYDAMNKGIAKAKGEYLLFLNAGDTLAAPNTLQMLARAAESGNTIIYGDSYEDNNYKPARDAAQIAAGLFTHHQAILYNRKQLGKMHYNLDYKIAADYDLTARLLQKKNASALFVPIPICIFESGGLSQQNAKAGRKEQFTIRKELELCTPVKNHIITWAQSLLWGFRTLTPNLYWHLKSSGNSAPAPSQSPVPQPHP